MNNTRMLLSGNEAVALAMKKAGIHLGTGYPGTPSSEILKEFALQGGKAQWAPNEKVALEVAIGAAFAKARTAVTMKHVGVNVAADPLFTAAYTGVDGALVIIAADDPGMASSQNEQDSRRYAIAAGIPMIEPADSAQAYRYFFTAVRLSEKYHTPVIFRMTTRVCHSKSIVYPDAEEALAALPNPPQDIGWTTAPDRRVMIPGYARGAHRRLRAMLDSVAKDESFIKELTTVYPLLSDSKQSLGIIANGISVYHAREAVPEASVMQIGLGHPFPIDKARTFAKSVDRCVIIEEGDPVMAEILFAEQLTTKSGKPIESRADRDVTGGIWRYGELSVERVRLMLAGSKEDAPAAPRGRPPQLCAGCPHRTSFDAIKSVGCIVAGDIGCYTLGVQPPWQSMDTCVCMGAAIGVGLGLRHVLPDKEAKRVISVIGDSTFMHSGLTGLLEMRYNPPKTGHVVVILDNGTTAMTGMQEHPGTGLSLDGQSRYQVDYATVAKAMGIDDVTIVELKTNPDPLAEVLREKLASEKLCVIIARRPCVISAGKKKS